MKAKKTVPPKKDTARERRIAVGACRFAYDLLTEMERQGALRLPFPNHPETMRMLRLVLERKA